MDSHSPYLPLHATPPAKLAWLVVLVLIWALYGMTGRDAWQNDEAIALGQVLDWLKGEHTPLDAPLYTWVAGLSARLLEGRYPLQDGARWASGLFSLVAVLFTALAARSLYGPGFGAIAALLLMGAFGLLLRAHALLPEAALVAGYALLLYGLAASRQSTNSAWAIMAGGLVLFLTRGVVDLAAAVLCATLPLALPGFASRSYRQALIKAGLLLAVILAAWLAYSAANGDLAPWWAGQAARIAAVRNPGKVFATLTWFAWPAWPLALAAVWREHRRLGRDNPLHLPLAASITTLLISHFPAYSSDGLVMPSLVPLTLLAVYGIATLRRGAAQAFYWFGVTCFVFFALAFWLYFLALEWGFPPALAAHLARLTPGYQPHVPLAGMGLAAAATLIWYVAVPFFPRAQVRPALVWATGMTLTWLLLITLLKPWAELSWGYRPVAVAVTRHLPAGACLEIAAQGPPRIMLDYHLAERLPQAGRRCNWRLELGGRRALEQAGARLVWEGYRPRYKDQVYRLYRLEHDGQH